MESEILKILNDPKIKLQTAAIYLGNHEGRSVFKEVSAIRQSFNIFSDNYRTFNKTTKKYYSNRLGLVDYKRWHYQRIVTKDIFNLISSGFAYLEHYDKSRSYLNEPLFAFLKELRNFITHHQALPLLSTFKSKSVDADNDVERRVETEQFETFEPEKFQVYLEKQIIKYSKREGLKLALNYLTQHKDKIQLNQIFQDFNQELEKTHHLSMLSYVDSKRSILEEFYVKVHEIHKKLKEFGIKPKHPISPAQLRYLNWLLLKSKGLC